MRLKKSEKEKLYTVVTQEIRDHYLQKTGIKVTDSFLELLFVSCRERNALASIVGTEKSKLSPAEAARKHLEIIADNWDKSELLFALKRDGYVNVEGENVYIDPERIAELQHYKGKLYANNAAMKSILSQLIEFGVKDTENKSAEEINREKTSAIHQHIDRILRSYKSSEEEIWRATEEKMRG